MASKTEIANRALAKLGEPRVSNIETTDTTPAQTMNGMWDQVRDAMLQSYPWNFAIKRKSVAKDGDWGDSANDWGYDNKFTLPTDFLSLIEIYKNPDYRIEDGAILTDEGAPLKIQYIARITNTGLFDAMFAEALASRLAYEAAERLTQSNTKKEAALQDFQFAIDAAFRSDAIQDPPAELLESEWLNERA